MQNNTGNSWRKCCCSEHSNSNSEDDLFSSETRESKTRSWLKTPVVMSQRKRFLSAPAADQPPSTVLFFLILYRVTYLPSLILTVLHTELTPPQPTSYINPSSRLRLLSHSYLKLFPFAFIGMCMSVL